MLLNNKNILITGGLGFIGSNLVNRLKINNRIFVLDNLSTDVKRVRFKGVKYIIDSCYNAYDLFKNKPLDIIFHLGEYSRVENSFEDIDLIYEYNIKPFYQILKLANYHRCKIIYAASSSKYGSYENRPISPYTLSKINNVSLLKIYCEQKRINFAIVYMYNVYGKGEIESGKYATVIAKLLKAKKENKTFYIHSDGQQKRNFTHIDDTINALILVAKYGKGDNYGISNLKSYPILEIVKFLKTKYKFKKSKTKGNRLKSRLFTKKLKNLGWKAQINLKDYLISHL